MAKSINKVQLLGYVGKDPEIRAIPSGAKVANFSIATTESWIDKTNNQKQEKTEWHNLVAWQGLAEIIGKFVKKGSRILVEGKLQTRSWDDQAGNKRYMTEIVLTDLTLLGDPRGAQGGAEPARNTQVATGAAYGPGGAAGHPDDVLPF